MTVSMYGADKQWRNGKVRRRYLLILTDLTGVTHEIVTNAFSVDPSDDGAGAESQYLTSFTDREVQSFKQSVANGSNPFGTEVWNSRNALLKAVLDDALSLPATDPIVYNGLPYVTLVTDAEFLLLYPDKDQAWVDNVRAKATALSASKAAQDDYVPVFSGGV